MEEILKDCILTTPTWNRFEVTRACLLSAMAFGGLDCKSFQVIDDGSDDPRLRAWLKFLEDAGRFNVTWRPENQGVGYCQRYAAETFAKDCDAMYWMDSDIVLAPDALETLRRAYQYWWRNGRKIGVLYTSIQPRCPPCVPTKEWELAGHRHTNSTLGLFHAGMLKKHAGAIHKTRKSPVRRFSAALRRDGYTRDLCLSPRVRYVHLGRHITTIPRPAERISTWAGIPPAQDVFPENISEDWFVENYPQSALDIGDRIIGEYMTDQKLQEDARAADEAAG